MIDITNPKEIYQNMRWGIILIATVQIMFSGQKAILVGVNKEEITEFRNKYKYPRLPYGILIFKSTISVPNELKTGEVIYLDYEHFNKVYSSEESEALRHNPRPYDDWVVVFKDKKDITTDYDIKEMLQKVVAGEIYDILHYTNNLCLFGHSLSHALSNIPSITSLFSIDGVRDAFARRWIEKPFQSNHLEELQNKLASLKVCEQCKSKDDYKKVCRECASDWLDYGKYTYAIALFESVFDTFSKDSNMFNPISNSYDVAEAPEDEELKI